MSALRRIAARLAWAVFVVWAVTTITFVIEHAMPGDPARLIAGVQARPADVALLRTQLGLDRPLAEQYAIFVRRLVHRGAWDFDPKKDKAHATCAAIVPGLHLDLGRSFSLRAPVVSLIGERLPRTIALGALALFFQIAIGVPLGSIAARRRGRVTDTATVAGTLVGVSAPTFITGLFLQWLFAFELGVLPSDGFGTTFAQHAAGAVLPALTLGLFGAAYYTRLVRDEMILALQQDFVRTAEAKGASRARATIVHALRTTLAPLATIVGMEAGALVGGAIVTESIFRWPGIGQLSVTALLNRDGPVIVGVVLVTSTALVLANVIVDLAYALLDPRARA